MFNKYLIKGNMYELGLRQGEIFTKAINEEISKYEELLKEERIANITDGIIEKIKKDFPNSLDELYGKADGAKVDRRALVLMHSPEVYSKFDGCTTAIYKKADRVLFSHNEDDQGYNHENTALIKFDYGDHWLVSYSAYHKLTGSCFGYNSYGLVFSCNYLFHEKANLDFLSRYIVTRDIVESKSLEECLEKLNKHRTASPFSYNVLDLNTLKVANIEHDLDKDYITYIDDKYARSNHFLNKENPKMSESSKNRNLFAKERISKLDCNCELKDLIEVLAYEDEDYYKCILMDPLKYQGIDNSVTVANMAFDSKTKEVIITDYLDHSIWKHNYGEF